MPASGAERGSGLRRRAASAASAAVGPAGRCFRADRCGAAVCAENGSGPNPGCRTDQGAFATGTAGGARGGAAHCSEGAQPSFALASTKRRT